MPAFAAGGKIAFTSNRDGNSETYVMNADGSAQTNLSNTVGVQEGGPRWRWDGGKIVYQRTDALWTMNADGSGQAVLSQGGGPQWPDFHPSGSPIIFSRPITSDYDVVRVNADGSGLTQILSNTYGDYFTRWSPDGNKFTFYTFFGSNYTPEVCIANANGSGQLRLTTAGNSQNASWSPDGSKIVFRSSRDGNNEIYVMNPDGTNQTRLTAHNASDDLPCFSPDGTQIAFVSNRAGNNEIHVMNADGSGVTQLTTNSANDTEPSWIMPVPAGSPTLNVSDAAVTEGDSGTTDLSFVVRLTAASSQTVTVQSGTSNGTATAPGDYTVPAPVTLTFAPGQTSKLVKVAVQGDTLDEANETLNLTLRSATNAFLGDSAAVGTIVDNDPFPTISIADVSQFEGNSNSSNFVFALTLSAPSSRTISVSYATSDGTATQAVDYSARSGTVSFAAGVTTANVSVPVIGDASKEADETFLVTLSAPVNATLADNQATATIRNDDLPIISISTTSVTEGDSGQTDVTFTVTLSQASTDAVSFDFATAPGTATADEDYITASGSRTILPGDTSKTISVSVNGDIDNEANETFFLVLSNPVNAFLASGLPRDASTGNAYQLVTASLNWDNARTAAAARTYLGTSGHLATITSAAEQSYVANLISGTEAWIGGTQPSGSPEPAGGYTWITGEPFNYTNWSSGEPNNAGGEDTVLFGFNGLWNDLSRASTVARYLVEYDNVPNAVQAVATIINDDTPPSLSIDSVQIIEGSGGTQDAVFTITVNGVSKKPISVDVATQDGTALAGVDYESVNSTISIPVGQATATFSVPITTDLADEGDETFTANLSNPVNATLAFAAALPRDPATGHAYELVAASLSWSNARAAAAARSYFGVSGHLATVTSAAEQSFIATIATNKQAWLGALQPAGSAEPGGGFTWITGEPFVYTNWRSGEPNNANPTGIEDTLYYTSTGTWNDISADVVDAAVTFYLVEYDNAANTAQGVATITDDDATPTLSVNDVQVIEGSGGTNEAVFTITVNGLSERVMAVDVVTQNGTALSGVDYQNVNRTVLIAAGQTSVTVSVPITTDLADEDSETFTLNLSGATNATIADAQGLGTISDDDNAPTVNIDDVTITEGNSATSPATFTVTLSNPSSRTVTVQYAAIKGTTNPALVNSDFRSTKGTLTFNPGETTKTITVPIVGDYVPEADETFFVSLSRAVNAMFGDSQGLGTVTNDDFDTTPPTVSFTTAATTPPGTTPVNGATITSSTFPTITGIAADSGSGVAKVVLRLYRQTATAGVYEYWNGSAWITPGGAVAIPVLTTTLSPAAGGASVTWSRSSAWPDGASFADGTYYLSAYAYDRAGKLATSSRNFKKAGAAQAQNIAAPPASGTANASAGSIALSFSGTVPAGDFTVQVNGVAATVQSTERSGQSVTLLLPNGSLQVEDQVSVSWPSGALTLTAE